MPNSASILDTSIAALMYQAGVSVNMDYGISSSSSYVLAANCPLRYNAQFALINYFCYKPGIKGLYRQDFTDNTWIATLENELLAGRPLIYNGLNDSEGHSFIADGFDADNNIHFNWGWGGSWNGYYSIDSIVPDSISFMKSNSVLVGIQPDSSRSLIADAVSQPTNTVHGHQSFTVNSRIINTGLSDFSGDITGELTGDAYPYFLQIKTLSNISLPAGDSTGLTFNFPGMTPGEYHIRLWYGGSYFTLVDSTAEYANYDPISVYGNAGTNSCTVSPNPAYDYAYISLNGSEASAYRMFSATGAIIASGMIDAGAPILALPVRFIGAGIYRVFLETPGGQQHLTVSVVH